MIDDASVLHIVIVLFGCWGAGFGVGKAVAWTRKISQVA